MKILRVCLAQINPLVGDLQGNANKIIDSICQAKKYQADIIAFPELSLSGYPPEDLLLKPHFIKESQKMLLQVIRSTKSILCIIGFPCAEKDKLFNAAALIYNGKLLAVYKKIFLPNYGVFDERRYFYPGAHCHILAFGKEVKVGVNICEDIWVAHGPSSTQAQLGGAKVIINISASPYHIQKIEFRQKMLKLRARENNAFIFYCNLVGGQDELVFDGGSLVYDNKGSLLARGKQFAEDFIIGEVNLDLLRPNSLLKSKRPLKLSKSSLQTKVLPKLKEKKIISSANMIAKKLTFLEEIYAALKLGIKDYVSKNEFKKVLLGLSGGIDSALTAVLAVDALKRENVIALTMPSIYSSKGTRHDAKQIADNLGIKLISVPIDEIYKKYISALRKHFKGRKAGVAEENIQARIRGNLLMAFSNKLGWLVLTTGNKSELSTGYCTLYGDMAGGFAALKDLPKGLVYKLAEYRNSCGKKRVIPQGVFRRPPSAELRRGQKDEDSLPAYSILDRIIDLYVEKDKSADEIVKKGFKRDVVNKVICMVDRNEYKRRQAPPGIKLTPRAFGKDRRMPITNKFFG
jgi:NAD+ synthase (glutamine-hydrolysing)